MNELGRYTPEEADPIRIELRQLATAENTLSSNTIIYVPPVKGNFPSEDSLTFFSHSSSSVFGVDIHEYGKPLSTYTSDLTQELGKREHIDPHRTYVVGYSNGGGFAAEAGIHLGLPKEQILIVAPILSIPRLARQQVRNVVTKVIHPHSQTEQAEKTAFDFEHAKKMTGLLRHGRHWKQLGNMRQFAVPSEAQLERVTVVSGGKDSVSRPTERTGILVENAGHRFADFAPTIAQYIAQRSQSSD